MPFLAPTIPDFKTQFVRDFPYGTDPVTSVLDVDIASAYNMVNVNVSQSLWPNQQAYTLGYLFAAAHFLCLNLRASSQGINGQYNWIQNSKSVQGVAEGFTIPQRLVDNPFFAMLTKTNYGARFFELVYPRLMGQVFIAHGRTLP